MAIVMKGNKQLKVDDAVIDKYLKDGFNEIDSKGNVKTKASHKSAYTPAEYKSLEKSVSEFSAKLKAAEAEIAKLKSENKKADKTSGKTPGKESDTEKEKDVKTTE